MKTNQSVLMALAIGWGLSLAAPAHAEDFTFVVPVHLSNLPAEIDRFTILCSVFGAPRGRDYGIRLGGGNSGSQAISGGGYDGNVTVRFNASPTADPSLAAEYSCFLSFSGMVAGRRYDFSRTDSRDPTSHVESTTGTPPVRLPSAPGTRINTGVDGPIR